MYKLYISALMGPCVSASWLRTSAPLCSPLCAALRAECLTADVDVTRARFKYEGGSLGANTCWFATTW